MYVLDQLDQRLERMIGILEKDHKQYEERKQETNAGRDDYDKALELAQGMSALDPTDPYNRFVADEFDKELDKMLDDMLLDAKYTEKQQIEMCNVYKDVLRHNDYDWQDVSLILNQLGIDADLNDVRKIYGKRLKAGLESEDDLEQVAEQATEPATAKNGYTEQEEVVMCDVYKDWIKHEDYRMQDIPMILGQLGIDADLNDVRKIYGKRLKAGLEVSEEDVEAGQEISKAA
jgi:hypothetical protein